MTLFNWNDVKVAYFSLHLLAYQTNTDRCAKREAQAKIIEEEIIKRVNEGYEIIVIGDFNDYDEKNTDVNDSEPTSQVLDIIKGEQNEVYVLTNLASKIPKEEREFMQDQMLRCTLGDKGKYQMSNINRRQAKRDQRNLEKRVDIDCNEAQVAEPLDEIVEDNSVVMEDINQNESESEESESIERQVEVGRLQT